MRLSKSAFLAVKKDGLSLRRVLRIFLFCLFLLTVICVLAFFFAMPDGSVSYADGSKSEEEIERELSDAVDGAIDRLDTNLLQKFIDSLDESQRAAISIDNIKQSLRQLADGNGAGFFDIFIGTLSSAAAKYFVGTLPAFITIIIICLLKNLLGGMTGDFANRSTTEVVHIVCYCAVIIVLMSGVVSIISAVTDTILGLSAFAQGVFPVLLTLLSMLGGASSVATYSPLMAVLSGFIMQLITAVIVPAFIATIVFSVVGNISKTVKLDKLTKLVKSSSTWLIGIVFGLFAAFLTMQGISGGVVDKFGFNAAKFAVSSYVPILGGYLSDGFDLLTASIVLVKNAFGFTGALVLLGVVIFPLVKLVVFSLALRLTAAIVEPIGDDRVAGLLNSVADNMGLLVTALAGVAFMFFILIMLTIGSCNMGI